MSKSILNQKLGGKIPIQQNWTDLHEYQLTDKAFCYCVETKSINRELHFTDRLTVFGQQVIYIRSLADHFLLASQVNHTYRGAIFLIIFLQSCNNTGCPNKFGLFTTKYQLFILNKSYFMKIFDLFTKNLRYCRFQTLTRFELRV